MQPLAEGTTAWEKVLNRHELLFSQSSWQTANKHDYRKKVASLVFQRISCLLSAVEATMKWSRGSVDVFVFLLVDKRCKQRASQEEHDH